MTGEKVFASLLAEYTRHGWEPRRVLHSAEALPREMASILREFPNVEIKNSVLDAVWFTRRSRPGVETWELRRLVGSPFALVESIEDDTDEAEVKKRLRSIEERMIEHAAGPVTHG
jgi:hypothetical protein